MNRSLTTPVNLDAILISTVIRTSHTIARIVSMAVRLALMVPPVTNVTLTIMNRSMTAPVF
jgi:hypothetical protein